jgi:NADH-quinone oxidoreductase subunit H
MVSYEISLGLSLVGVLILSGSFSLQEIVAAQSGSWFHIIPKWNIFQGQSWPSSFTSLRPTRKQIAFRLIS